MKRMISFLLSLAMVITMLPAGAFAAELETEPVSETQAVTEAPLETEAEQTEAAETAPAETEEAVPAETEAPDAETVAETAAATVAVTEPPVAETTEAVVEETVAVEAVATAEDDFRAAVAAAEESGENLPIWDEITLTRDLTINMDGELSFADFSKLVVPSGVTLTLNCPTVVNGATLIVEEGGKLVSNVNLTVVAPMNPATFDMNGEFENNGILWIDVNGVVNINGTAVSYYAPIHIGFGEGGTLNVNGTLTSYGYFNANDKLNVNGTLILEKDENGNAYLQGGGTINVNGTLDSRAAVEIGNPNGTAVLTIAQGGQVTVAENSMWFDITGGTLVNNGTLTNNFYHIGNYGTLTNNGTLNNPAKIRNYGTYTNNGTVNGNAPVDGVADARNMFLEGVAHATASGENLPIWDEVILNEDLTINMAGELSFADFSKLVVPSGVTLTLNCPTVINGATLIVEEGGKLVSNVNLTVMAPMNPAVFDMNGEFENNGILWIDVNGVVNINGTAVSYYAPIHIGFGEGGTLNVNGTLTSYGYFNANDKLNVNGTLILEKDENGNAYLQGGGTINVNGTLDSRAAVEIGNPNGTAVLTIAQGGQVTVAENSMWFDITGGTLVNNGTLTNNFYHIGNYGTLTNNGTLNNPAKIRNYGTYTNNGTVNGNAPVDGVADARNMFLEGVARATASGENLPIWDEVILNEDLTINMAGELSFADFSKLVVPSGVTLTLNCATIINGATLVVEEGGKLVNNMSLTIVAPMNPATFDMNGQLENNGLLWINEGATANINGTAISDCAPIHVGFGGNGKTSTLNLNGTLTTNDYLNIAAAGADGVLNVNQGATLNILNDENGCGYLSNTSRVEINGTLNLDGIFTTGAAKDDAGNVMGDDAFAIINGTVIGGTKSSIGVQEKGAVNVNGTLTTTGEVKVEPNGALWVDGIMTMNGPAFLYVGGWLHVNFFDEDETKGVLTVNTTANVNFFGYLAVHGGGTLNVGESGVVYITNDDRGCAYLDNQGTVNMNGKMYVDGLFTTGAAMKDGVVVGPDAYATNNGTIEASATSTLGVGPGGTLTNNGTVTTSGALDIKGTWLGTPAVVETPVEEGTMTQEEFAAAIAAADGTYYLEDSVYIHSDMAISGFVVVQEGAELYICDGAAVTLNGIVQLNGGQMTIRDGGAVTAAAQDAAIGVINNGTLTIKTGGTLDVSAGSMGVDGGNVVAETDAKIIGDTIMVNPLDSSITGIPTSALNISMGAQNQDMLAALLEAAPDYKTAKIYIDGDFDLARELTVPAGTYVEVHAEAFRIVQGGKLTVSGDVVVNTNIYIDIGGAVTVANGGSITVRNLMQAAGGSVTIENGGSVAIDMLPETAGGFGVFDGGTLRICSGGKLDTGDGEVGVGTGRTGRKGAIVAEDGAVVLGNGFNLNYVEGSITGIPTGQISIAGPVYQQAQLEEVLSVAADYRKADVFVVYSGELTGKLTVPGNTTLNFMGSTCTIASGAEITVDGMLIVQESAVVTNNGTVRLAAAENLVVNGTWNGNPALVGEEPAEMSFEDFKAALATGYVQLDAKVTIQESLEANGVLYIQEGGEIVVPSGVTLTLTRYTQVAGGKITVEEGGTLIVNAQVRVENGGALEVSGTYISGDFARVTVVDGESTVTGIDKSLMMLQCNAETEEELRQALEKTGYKRQDIQIRQSIRLSEALVLGGEVDVQLYDGAELTVPSGVTLTVDAYLHVFDAGIAVEKGGTLCVTQKGYLQVASGYLRVNGTVETPIERIHVSIDGNVELTGVDKSLVGARGSVGTYEELCSAVEACGEYSFVEIEPYATITVENNLAIPANAMFAMYDDGELMQLIIPEGVTLINCGSIVINTNCQVWIQEGATLDNQGGITEYHDQALIVEGTLLENNGSEETVAVADLESLMVAIGAGKRWINIYGSITLTQDLVVPAESYISIYEGGGITVPNGVTLTILSGMSIYGGALTVKAGGAFTAPALYVDGTVTVEPAGSFTVSEQGGMGVQYGSTITGIDKKDYSLEYHASNEAEIRAGLKLTGYNWTAVYLFKDVTLTSNLSVPEGVSLVVDARWVDGERLPVTLTVPTGKTLTNNGSLITSEPMGCLNIARGGKVINNASFYNRGSLVNNGEVVNNGMLAIYGTMSGDGKITGDGHVDYARVAFTHEELTALLSSDMVPTYIYVGGELTLEDDITIPEGSQLIMEGSTLIVPDGVTVTINGELYAQYEGTAIFEAGSKLINNGTVIATQGGVITFQAGSEIINSSSIDAFPNGILNVFGTYVRENVDANLALYENGTINGTDNSNIHYAANFTDDASLAAIISAVETLGYGQFTARVKFGSGMVELYEDVTIPENGYLFVGKYYEDSLVLKSGTVLTNYGEIVVVAPGTLVVESGAEIVNHGKIDADEGTLIYLGGGITIGADATAVYGKGKLNLTAAITPESMSGAKVTWTLAEGHELFATLRGSGSNAVLTAADVTGEHIVKVTASATLENGAEVSDTIEIRILPLVKEITLMSGGQNVTGKTISFDLNYIPEGQTEAQRTLNLTALVAPGEAQKDVTWVTSSATIATVEDGVVTFTDKGGKVTITATAADGSKVSAKVIIEAVKLVQSITLLEGDTQLVGGKGTTLKVQDSSNPGKALAASAVSWALAEESDAAYVSVTAAGKVTTKAVPEKRTVKLLGTINGNPNAQPIVHTITVYPAVTQVDLVDGDEIYTGRTIKLSRGGVIILRAKQYPADSMGGVTWEVSDKTGKFVTVVSSGPESMILQSTGAKGNVTVKITSTDGSRKSATVKLQTGTYVEEVVVSSPSIELRSGESVQLNLEVKPANADNKAVVWSLADAADKQYVSVSSSGKVTAKKGLSMSKEVTILATAKDGYGVYGSYTFQLQPADPGALVILGEEGNVTGTTVNVDLLTGGDVKLKAKYFNTDSAEVTWSGKNVTFGPKDENGFITAKVSAKGTFSVTATDGSGKKATVKLKAANLSSGVEITGGTSVASGKSLQLSAIVLPQGKAADTKVIWWVDPVHTPYAKISSTGKLTATKNLTDARNITIWAQAKDGNSEPDCINIDILPLSQSVQILEGGADVTNTVYSWDLTGNTGKLDLSAEVFPADAGQGVTWKTSGAKVVEQAADGSWRFTGKTGTATITATASDGSGKKASFKLNVLRSMEFIEQSQEEAILAGGKSLKLSSFVTVDSNATNKKLTWSMTGDTEVATLSAAGVLKTKKVTDMKTIFVTAEAQDGSGCKAEFTVFVYPATTSVTLLCDGETAPKQATLGIGETLTLEGVSLPSAAAQGSGAYTWQLSSDKYVALVLNADGTVTVIGLASGTVTVTCTAADGSGKKATVKIKVG